MDDNTEGLTPQHGGMDGIEFDDLCATFFDGQFSATEKINSKTGEVSVEARFRTTNEALEDLFGGSQFSRRDDDHEHQDRANPDGKPDDKPSEYSDGLLTRADLFYDEEEDDEVRDPEWWDRENPEDDYDYETGRKTFRGTDPEDEPDYLVRNDRVQRIAHSSLDPAGKSIYATKSVRRQRGAAYRAMTKKLDGGWQEYLRLNKARRDVSSAEQYADKVRYLFSKFRKNGTPIPTTEAGWAEAVTEHEHTQAEKRMRMAVVDLICERQGCVRQTGYNRLKRLIKHATEKGRWHETLLNAYIREAARRSHEDRATKREERQRRPKRTPARATEPTPAEVRDRLRGDPMSKKPDYKRGAIRADTESGF